MSGNVDVGDAVELTFQTATGSTVTVSWYDPDVVPVYEAQPVSENPAGSGKFPYTFLPTRSGVWEARFTASGASTAVERYYIRASPISGPPPLATVGEVGAQFGTLTSAQEGLSGWLLRAASKIVRARFPKVDAQIAAGTLDPDVVALAVAAMVLRVLRNPGGLRAETVGPFSRTYDTTAAAGLLAITADEVAMLTPRQAPTQAGTIMVRPGLAPYPIGIRHGWRW